LCSSWYCQSQSIICIMKAVALLVVLAAGALAEESNPLGKVFELMSALEAKIVKEGEAEAKAFKEFFEWCDSASQNINFEIKTAKKEPGEVGSQDW
jgi:hypothetical protein